MDFNKLFGKSNYTVSVYLTANPIAKAFASLKTAFSAPKFAFAPALV